MKYTLLIFLLIASPAFAATEKRPLPIPSQRQGLTFEKNILPIFKTNCLVCHGVERQMEGVRLDSLDAVLQGGKKGRIVVPGKSRQSSLVTAIAQLDDETAMPPGAPRLSRKEIGLIRAWIIQGAH